MTEKQIISELLRAHRELDSAKSIIAQGLREAKSFKRVTKKAKQSK